MLIKVAGSALNQTPFDWSGNQKRILTAIAQARQQGASVLCLPELSITGYGCEDMFFSPHVHERALQILLDLLPSTQGMVVNFGLPLAFHGAIYNATAVVADGQLLGFVPKKFLAGDGVHYEPRWFKAWPAEERNSIEIKDQNYPIGDLHFDFSGIKIGFEICEEAWVAKRPGSALAARGVDIILNPSASHFAFGKAKVRRNFVCEGSRAFSVAYIYSNLLGNESGRIIFDGGVLIANAGQIVVQGPRFSFQEALVTTATVDLNRNRVNRSMSGGHRPEGNSKLCEDIAFRLPEAQVTSPQPTEEAWEKSQFVKEEEFTRALALALFDFMRKSKQNGFVVSLSGGVDSAAVTLLCRIALDFAAQELGFDAFRERLSHVPTIHQRSSVDELAREMITTAFQGTENSSKETLAAAQAIAEDAGAQFFNWTIDSIIQNYLGIAEEALHEKITWAKYDSTLQNIQARGRAPSIWIMANIKNSLLLATSNRSEAAVGYATMDGDTCGGISPIGGIDKNFLIQWAHWISEKGPMGGRTFASFQKVFAKPPSAELRPQDQHQTDEDDLMPYDVLDQIEKLAIRDKKSPAECLAMLLPALPQFTDQQMRQWVVKFFRLWCRNQWKRERYAPSFHLDDESLDPKTWCRFPILSSNFEEELAELEKGRAQ